MKTPKLSQIALAVMSALMVMAASADDAAIFRKNVSKTGLAETEYANVKMLNFYVPGQKSDGTLLTEGLPYVVPGDYTLDPESGPVDLTVESDIVKFRSEAKPLVAVFNDGLVAGVDNTAFAGHGLRDAYAAISLDDGATWQKKNLSSSAKRSSFKIEGTVSLPDGSVTSYYPGDVVAVFSATLGNQILVAWQSRYCKGGSPAYLLAPVVDEATDTQTSLKDINNMTYQDIFGVRGAQKSVNYATADFKMDDFDRAVGEVPFNCLWTARGTMYTKDGVTDVVWTLPERLTSGVRDVNRIEVASTDPIAGGFVVTWQEDPDGLLPGSGEGSGEGWAGATANHQTDIWYSYIGAGAFSKIADCTAGMGTTDINFDGEVDPVCKAVNLDLSALPLATPPETGIKMSVPVRLTDNAMCKPDDPATATLEDDAYCYADWNNNGTPDLCATTTTFNQGSSGSPDLVEVCVAEDGRILNGQYAATRARTVAKAATRDGKVRSWVAVAYEDSKGLGEIDEDGDGEQDEIGKYPRFTSFTLAHPSLVTQGMLLSQPATYWNETWAANAAYTVTPEGYRTYDVRPYYDPAPAQYTDDTPLYDTEIARRTSVFTQPISKAMESRYRTSYVALFKQGIINQGGPADIMLRRWRLPANFDPMVQNPFNRLYMVCRNPDGTSGWKYTNARNGGKNPHYVEGLCTAPATNLSGTIPEVCESGAEGTPVDCAFKTADAGDQSTFPKTIKWDQTRDQLTDQSWYNAYDISKGHRGFLDGDFMMVMYAWSPNWKQLADGRDHYNLYIRRSFTGGINWTTTPVELGGDGTRTCENYLDGTYECTNYGAYRFEKARNVSQLLTLTDTVLDPRYTPTPMTSPANDLVGLGITASSAYEDDARDRSKYFVAFESGDASYVGTEGEPHPWDMFASRAYNWGDDYYLVNSGSVDNLKVSFDGLETKDSQYSGEAALTSNPAGTFMYAIWNQWEYDTVTPEVDSEMINSDAIFRKVLFLYPTRTQDYRSGTGCNTTGPNASTCVAP